MDSSAGPERHRRLAPKQTPGSSFSPDSLNSSQQLSQKRRETTSRACENCRKRKSKCNGQEPSCSTCIRRRVKCEYSSARALDRASALALTNRVKLLDADRETMSQLFKELRSRSEGDAADILQRIRRGDDPEIVLRMIQEGDLLLQPWMASAIANNASTSSPLWGFAQREYDLYFWTLAPANLGFNKQSIPPIASDLLRSSELSNLEGEKQIIQTSAPMLLNLPGFEILLDDRFDKVSARQWTEVPCEDGRFSDLLRLYFITENPIWAFVEKDLFLDDLVSGRQDFCSPLLVNTILCFAAHSSHQVEHRHTPWDDQNIGSYFYREARRLWQLEESKASITTIQATYILAFILNTEGKDKVGMTFIRQAIHLGKDLGLFKGPMSSEEQDTLWRANPRYFLACAVTEWGLKRFEIAVCFFLRLPPVTKSTPSYPIPYAEEWKLGMTHTTRTSEAIKEPNQTYFDTLQRAKCELYLKLHEVTCIAFTEEGDERPLSSMPWEELLKYHEHLIDWYDSLPAALAQDATLVPQHLLFHMECHVALQSLSRIILAFTPSPTNGFPPLVDLSKTSARISRTLRSLAERFTFLHNCRQATGFVLHCLIFVAYDCLETGDLSSNLSSYRLFTTCYNALRDITAVIYLANSVLQALEATVQKQLGAMWAAPTADDSGLTREIALSEIIESTYSAYPSDLSTLDFVAARTDYVLRSLANLSMDTMSPAENTMDATSSAVR